MKKMKILLMLLTSAILVFSLTACNDTKYVSLDPHPPGTIYTAGMAWDDDYGEGEIPVPVWWNGTDTPTRLPMLPFSHEGCPPAGSVEGMTIVDNEVVMVGISSLCLDGSQNMKPVMWQDGIVTQLAFLSSDHVLGLAKDVAFKDDVLYIVGATGTMGPLPVLWVDGYPIELPLPDDYENGEADSIIIDGGYIYVTALLSKGAVGDLTWDAGYWKLDETLSWIDWTYITLPEGSDGVNSPVTIATAGEDVWTVANASSPGEPDLMKPALSMNGDTPVPIIDFEFDEDPWGCVYGLAHNGTSTLAVGYETLEEQYKYPGPVIWTDSNVETLSTVDESLGMGTAHCINVVGNDIYIGGNTHKKDTEDETMLISVPAIWKNGERHDRNGLASTGSSAFDPESLYNWPAWPNIPKTPNLPTSPYGVNASQSATIHAIAVK